ncbi:type II secretion system protein [Legionella resiliens]|uniref:Type II secretion system GspH family protein n=2 Tax=Legionella TaxID=445 RepID=A0ABS8X726_9GAMM|nr:type II secretion system protein [Legionella sp. 8cVS16]MCE3533351.1 type II secretion system GspH family protein [Legionella sp. 8cVS16]
MYWRVHSGSARRGSLHFSPWSEFPKRASKKLYSGGELLRRYGARILMYWRVHSGSARRGSLHFSPWSEFPKRASKKLYSRGELLRRYGARILMYWRVHSGSALRGSSHFPLWSGLPKRSIRKNQGFILLVTLLIISVISLLILTSMQHVLLYYKTINKQEVLHQNFYQLEGVALRLLQQQPVLNSECLMRSDSANQVIHNLLEYKGCSLKSGLAQYKYYIEDLGEFPCLVVRYKGRKSASHHQRVTVASFEDGSPASLLQIRLISAGRAIPCLATEHAAPLGVSSWRYLPSV